MMPASAPALRGALYYPYIHPRNVEWVKGTILAFGQINRLVPDGYPLQDRSEIAFLRDYPGPRNEGLVRSISPRYEHIEHATQRLAVALHRVDRTELRARYGPIPSERSKTRPYEIHRDKLHHGLLDVLLSSGLAWPARRVSFSAQVEGDAQWYGVHPELGAAIMSVIAIAAARHDGLDIVTDSMPLHQALAALDESTILAGLLHPEHASDPPTPEAQAVDQLVHMIMTTTFDLSLLSVQDIADLVSDGHDLRVFKTAVADAASVAPLDAAAERREALLRQAAESVIEQWEQFRQTMPRRLKAALREGGGSTASAILKRAGAALTVAATGGVPGLAALAAGFQPQAVALASGVGIAVGLVAFGRSMLAPKRDDPYRYLTRITKAGATLLVVPRPYRTG